jgi:DeoR family transcriptional regulator, fructose operon transcriptional repressor
METQIEGSEIHMYAEGRHQLMVKRARLAGRVDVAGLAEEFDVTAETVRREMTILERHGLLRRVHGGAIPVERLSFEPGLCARDVVMQAEKERIAKAPLDELPGEGAVSSMGARRRDGWPRSSRPIGSSGL